VPATPLDRLDHWAATHPDRVFLRQPEGGRYRDLTFGEVRRQARCIAGALRHLGIEPGDTVALFSKNCAEWFVADLAIMLGGFVSVPVYPTANAKTVRYILEHSEARAVFVGKLDRPEGQEAALGKDIPRLGLPYPTPPVDHSWQALLDMAALPTDAPRPQPHQPMSIVYTSGSTGPPKGVVHTVASLSWAGETVARDLQATPEDRTVSYLPLAHITERVYIEMGSLYAGNPVAFVESLDTFLDDLMLARPTMFISVPRLWTLFRERVLATLGPRKLDVLLAVPRLNDFIRGRVRRSLGLEYARLLGCGSAPVDSELLRWYERIGLDITEGWGMTENAAYGTIQHPFRGDKIGSVGRPAIGAEFRVSERGELLFKSPGLMKGYHKQPEETAAVFTEDGFLRTGDLGYVDTDGYVFVTGRVKDIFKTGKGLYVSPVPIELELLREEVVGMACVIGSGLPQPIAVVQLADTVRESDREALRSRLGAALERLNGELVHHERLDAIVVSDKPWSVENDLLTPTLKVKRHVLERRFQALDIRPRKGTVTWLDELTPRR
jgi:long-subunit acyl-CoA synthetase (AMP-forming)